MTFSFFSLCFVFLLFSGFLSANLGGLGVLSMLALIENKRPGFFASGWENIKFEGRRFI
jgi:hypothetical protein